MVRDVELEGQGYFDVVHDSTRPFRVHTSHGIAEDIGTAFSVSAYPEVHGVQVLVASGAVVVHGRAPRDGQKESHYRRAITLTRGDAARIDTLGRATVRRDIDVASQLAWTHGTLVFRRTPLRDVIPQLNRWYDINVQLGDSTLADYVYTASLGSEPVSHVLELLAASIGTRLVHRGDTIVLLPTQPR
jgi:transmembrane sensor